uniref:Olduvai domain-containing protein n=1 Tax=Catagonus wagneri TaxID=51154 RepID=A0A8C3WFR2_9CETA
MSLLETNLYLRSQLEKSKQDFRDLTEKFLTSQATAYSLANQLQKYKCEEYKDLIESVLEEEALFQDEELAEKMRLAARLGEYNPLIQAQARELTHLRQKIQEGKSACYLFTQHVKNTAKSFENVLRSSDLSYYQGQRFCELLAQGSQLAERLASKLAIGKLEEMNEVLEDSLDERYLTHSSCHDSHQTPSSNAFACDVQELQLRFNP